MSTAKTDPDAEREAAFLRRLANQLGVDELSEEALAKSLAIDGLTDEYLVRWLASMMQPDEPPSSQAATVVQTDPGRDRPPLPASRSRKKRRGQP